MDVSLPGTGKMVSVRKAVTNPCNTFIPSRVLSAVVIINNRRGDGVKRRRGERKDFVVIDTFAASLRLGVSAS